MYAPEIKTAVVTLNWNNAWDTLLCLESLEESNRPVMPIVVDNASTEPGFDQLSERFSNAVFIRNSENIGFGRGTNTGIRWVLENTNVDYIFILNNDAQVKPNTVSILESYLDNNPTAGGVTPQIVFADAPEVVWYGGGEIDWRRGSARVHKWRQAVDVQASPRPVTFASGCAMLLRRTTIERIGGFDPLYFMYEEDVDLCLRLALSGTTLVYVPQAIVLHRVQGSQRGESGSFFTLHSPHNPRLAFFMYYLTRNRLLNMYKYALGRQRLNFVLFFSARWIFKVFQFVRHGRWDAIRAIFRGYRAYLQIRGKAYVDEVTGKVVSIRRAKLHIG